jgi:hypothetical protein
VARKRRKMSEIQKERLALDGFADEVAAESPNGRHDASFGGKVHLKFTQWRRDNPDTSDELHKTFPAVHSWDTAKKPQIAKSGGQGILGFYMPDGHLPCDVDDPGARVSFKNCGPQQWDGWWEVQMKDRASQEAAFQVKEDIYWQVRGAWAGPKDTADRVLREVFHWNEDMNLDEGMEEATEEFAFDEQEDVQPESLPT